ncbi:TonB-dependent hemoglobin/transferrin/lactoferrin family receptor [Luteolibacter pohnpeiensis]|uniref:TonB-dependent hemoglobin/transferrin/lactoferrin family receptor n=1 Tax=Luteolibacter pohnpeiensis TaxID=454153 RepID=A0A934VUB3_9BACT|nr:TonB-dependent hemoglobin/transferrin/lactoferrin family receptor [Luteolibacter pohnpeiensis]MBK1880955.1 TonB-dependent hemoglobin/transferrin/lactoferrin family receptor [Luteolibacter pohnpeiensis]
MISPSYPRYFLYGTIFLLTSIPGGFGQETPQESEQSQEPDSPTLQTLEDMIVVASLNPEKWLDTKGTVTRVNRKTMEETGVQDLGGIVKYDPTVVVPFDMTTGDGAVAYGSSGASSFNIRGIEGNRVGIEVDGIRQPPEYVSTSFDGGSETGAGGMGRDYFDPSMFQLVEILKGGASALYGSDAMGGVVSMKTLEPSDIYRDKNWGGLARTQYFSSNDGLAWQLGGAGKSGPVDYLLLYAGRDTNETSNNGSISPDPMSLNSDSWLGKVGYDAGDHVIQFTFEHYHRDVYADMQSALHPSIEMFNIYKQSIENWQEEERNRASVKWTYRPVASWIDGVETQLYWQKVESSSHNISTNPRTLATERTDISEQWREWIATTNPDLMVDGRNREQWIDFITEIYGLNTVARKSIDLGHTHHLFTGGIDLSQEESSNRFDRIETNGTVVPDLTGPAGTFEEETVVTETNRISFAPATTTRLGLFLQDEAQVSPKWDLTGGLRFDFYDINTDLTEDFMQRLQDAVGSGTIPEASDGYQNITLSPRLDIAYHTTENTRLYAGYGMGVRNPSAEELTMVFDHPSSSYQQITIPNPDLQEEVSHAFKLGYKGESRIGRFGAELFYTRYQDFIENNVVVDVLEDGSVITTAVNRGSAEIYGIEASGEWNADSWKPALKGVTLGLNAAYTIGNNLTTDEPINTVEPWKIIGYLGYADPEGKFGSRLIGTYTGAMTRTDDTTMNGEMFHPPAWFTLDLVSWWKPVPDLTLNIGINNIFDEKYWNWGTVRRSGGHLGLDSFGGQASSVDDRTTAPGRNFFISATYQF